MRRVLLRARARFTDALAALGVIDRWPRYIEDRDNPGCCQICGEPRGWHGQLVEHCESAEMRGERRPRDREKGMAS